MEKSNEYNPLQAQLSEADQNTDRTQTQEEKSKSQTKNDQSQHVQFQNLLQSKFDEDTTNCFDYEKQVLANERIANSIIIPFNQSKLIQTMCNPNNPEELISVHLVQNNVVPLKSQIDQLSLQNQTSSQQNKCQNIENGCCEYCCNQFVRDKVQNKAPKHHQFKAYKIIKNESQNQNEANLVEDFKIIDENSEQKDTKRNAIIGFWRMQVDQDCNMVCYNQFIINNPISKLQCQPQQEQVDEKEETEESSQVDRTQIIFEQIIFKSKQNNQLFYFTSEDNCELSQESRINLNIIELSQKVIIPKKYKISESCWKLLFDHFGNENENNILRSLPILLIDNFLIFNSQNIENQELCLSIFELFSSVQNLISVGDGDMRLKFFIKNVMGLIDLSRTQEQKTQITVFDKTQITQFEVDLSSIVENSELQLNSSTKTFQFEAKIQNKLDNLFKNAAAKGQINAYFISKKLNDKEQVILSFENQDWINFELNSSAKEIREHLKMADHAFLEYEDQLLVVGNLIKEVKKDLLGRNNQACGEFNFLLFNFKDQLQTKGRQETIYVSQEIQISLEPEEIGQSIAIKLIPLKLNRNDAKELKDQSNKFNISLVYQCKEQKYLDLCFAQSVGYKEQMKKYSQKIELHHQNIAYPILMYSKEQPILDKLMVANLAVDVPQIEIDIKPYRFIRFVKTDMQGYSGLNQSGICSFYFIVERDKRFFLMNYTIYPWYIYDENYEFSQTLKLDYEIQFPEIEKKNRPKLIEVIKLTKMTTKGIKGCLIFQYHKKKAIYISPIEYFGGKVKDFSKEQSENNQNIADSFEDLQEKSPSYKSQSCVESLKMFSGLSNEVFFVQFDDGIGYYQIMQISYFNQLSQPESRPIYQQKQAIIAIQFKHEQPLSFEQIIVGLNSKQKHQDDPSGIYLIDDEFKFKFIQKTQKQMSLKSEEQSCVQYEVLFSIRLRNRPLSLDQTIIELNLRQFPSIILSERSIILPYWFQSQNNGDFKLMPRRKGYNIKSETEFEIQNFDFNGKCIQYQQGLADSDDMKYNQQSILYVQSVPWTGKHLAVVNEGNYSYFHFSQSPDIRRIDLMNYVQMRHFATQIFALDRVILIEVKDKNIKIENQVIKELERIFVFDNRTFLLIDIFQGRNTKIITQPLEGIQFVEHTVKEKVHLYQYNSHFDGNSYKYLIFDEFSFNETRQNLSRLIFSGQDSKKQTKNLKKLMLAFQKNQGRNQQVSKKKTENQLESEKINEAENYFDFPQIPDQFTIQTKDQCVEDIKNQVNLKFEGKVSQLLIIPKKQLYSENQQKSNFEEEDLSEEQKDILMKQKDRVYIYKEEKDLTSQISEQRVKADKKLEIKLETYMLFGECFQSNNLQNLNKIQFTLTKDYLVILCNQTILFVELNKINSLNQIKSESNPKIQSQIFIIQQRENQILQKFQGSKIQMQYIDINTLFNSEEVQQGITIQSVSQHQVSIVERYKLRKNVIQISLANNLLLWDLDENQELMNLAGYNQLSKCEQFVKTGFVFPYPKKQNKALCMQDVKYQSASQNFNVVCIPTLKKKKGKLSQVGNIFKLFTDLDLYEIIELRDKIKCHRHIFKIDPQTVLIDLFGETLFTIFFRNKISILKFEEDEENKIKKTKSLKEKFDLVIQEKLIQQKKEKQKKQEEIKQVKELQEKFFITAKITDIIDKQIEESELEPFIDKKGQSYDNIYIRQITQLLKMPMIQKFDIKNYFSVLYLTHCIQSDDLIKINQYLQYQQYKTTVKNNSWLQNCKTSIIDFISRNQKKFEHRVTENLIEFSLGQKQNEALRSKVAHLLEHLFNISIMSRESKLGNSISKFQDFENLLKNSSPKIDQFLQNSFILTPQSSIIKSLHYDLSEFPVIFGANSTQHSESFIRKQIEEEINPDQIINKMSAINSALGSFLQNLESCQKVHAVEVRIIEIEWIEKKIKHFFRVLADYPEVEIFEYELVKILSAQYYGPQIFIWGFTPFLLHLISVEIYYFNVITQTGVSQKGFFAGDWLALKIIILLSTIILLSFEFVQLKERQFNYFTNYYNLFQVISYCLNLSLVIIHSQSNLTSNESDPILLSQWASIASCILWAQMFYWMRVKEGLSFYVLMVSETILEIRYFIIMIFICMTIFASGMLVLDRKSKSLFRFQSKSYDSQYYYWDPNIKPWEISPDFSNDSIDPNDTPLLPQHTGNSYFDAWLNFFLFSTGATQIDGYDTSQFNLLCWFYFIFTFIMLNIIFMNILIAVVGDVKAKISSQQDRYALQQRIQIYSDYIGYFKLNEKYCNYRYLYVVRPVENSKFGTEKWDGGINMIKNLIKQTTIKANHIMSTKLNDQKAKQDKMQNQLMQIEHNQNENQHLMKQIDAKLDKLFEYQIKNQQDYEFKTHQEDLKMQPNTLLLANSILN